MWLWMNVGFAAPPPPDLSIVELKADLVAERPVEAEEVLVHEDIPARGDLSGLIAARGLAGLEDPPCGVVEPGDSVEWAEPSAALVSSELKATRWVARAHGAAGVLAWEADYPGGGHQLSLPANLGDLGSTGTLSARLEGEGWSVAMDRLVWELVDGHVYLGRADEARYAPTEEGFASTDLVGVGGGR